MVVVVSRRVQSDSSSQPVQTVNMGSLSLSLYTISVATFILLGITYNLLLPSLVTAVTHCRCDDV